MESGINAALTVALSKKVGRLPYIGTICTPDSAKCRESEREQRQNEVDSRLLRPPKSTFMDATVARGFMSDCTMMVLPALR